MTGYGISLSTLEEVFMKVGHLEEGDAVDDQTRSQRLGSVKNKDKPIPELPTPSNEPDNEQLKVKEAQFSIAESALDESFCNNFKAVIKRRTN